MQQNLSLEEMVQQMRRNSLAAAMRNINLHVFNGRASSLRMAEYLAERLNVRSTDVRLWLTSGGVPEIYANQLLDVLNEHSVWGRHQILPSKRLAQNYMEATYA
ncbi:hypothetical protein GCM10007938_26810 [Vibrio zhanjiangensis]|uniref:Uncharacterized protein n=1 Tax=Vibrio zhanjiangensis TaxID=1046128 RepID=A0ABQ6F0Z1_9VIBR|nr:hypothetical protein [Vibrio zhanjiangensis]GLT18899.1 hypothetical protein GCM10007938_26810 [Vibrio zhanjiangensis]